MRTSSCMGRKNRGLPEDDVEDDRAGEHDHAERGRTSVPRSAFIADLFRQRINQAAQFVVGVFGLVASEMTSVAVKQPVKAKIAIQKFWAIELAKVCWMESQPPLSRPGVSPDGNRVALENRGAERAGQEAENAPWPVVRRQNMPSRKVANSGAFTKPNTSWSMSMMLLNFVAA
jgi:hypothetical protein